MTDPFTLSLTLAVAKRKYNEMLKTAPINIISAHTVVKRRKDHNNIY